MNELYPVFLDLRGRKTVVVGGGGVASRKALAFLSCRARVLVVAPRISEEIRKLSESGTIEVRMREFEVGDMDGAAVAVAASDDPEVNVAVWEACREAGILCNVVDDPSRCDFHVPAVATAGDLKIAVSTGGRAPCFAAVLRAKLEKIFGERYALALSILGGKRDRVLSGGGSDSGRRKALLEAASSERLWDFLEGRTDDLSAEDP